MTHAFAIAGCLGLLLAYLLLERGRRNRALAAIPLRIHVNGTRGKSTVTRLIWAALREAGLPAMAKTSGTAARLLMPDGRELPWPRRGPATVLEQVRFLDRARRAGAQAVVVECMAVRPELQWVSEREMVRSTIGVITNSRTDHTEAMGREPREIARSLSNSTPRGGTLVLGATEHEDVFLRRAHASATRVVRSQPMPGRDLPYWLEECRSVALAVCREAGIAEELALRGMSRALPDPGAAREGALSREGVSVPYLDATAANDPESLEALLRHDWPIPANSPRVLFIYNHRADRPERLEHLTAALLRIAPRAGRMITGNPPCRQLVRRLRRTGAAFEYVPSGRLAAALGARLALLDAVLFCGNTRAFDVRALVQEVARG